MRSSLVHPCSACQVTCPSGVSTRHWVHVAWAILQASPRRGMDTNQKRCFMVQPTSAYLLHQRAPALTFLIYSTSHPIHPFAGRFSRLPSALQHGERAASLGLSATDPTLGRTVQKQIRSGFMDRHRKPWTDMEYIYIHIYIYIT